MRKSMADSGGGEHPNGRPADDQPSTTSIDPLGDFAADLGNFLGGVQSRAASWLEQRKAIADQLTQIRDTANQYLQQLSGGQRVTTPSMLAEEVARREGKARRGRPPGSKNLKRAVTKGPAGQGAVAGDAARPKKRFMSAEARARIADAQRKRWAKVRKAARRANR